MNHWVALTAELEDTRESIAKAIFKLFKEGKVTNEFAMDHCRKLDELFKDAKKYEVDLATDFKGYTQAKEQDNVAKKAEAAASSVLSKLYIRHQVAQYKRTFKDQFVELGQKAINSLDDGISLVDDAHTLRMCRYAIKLKKDADERWEEIQILHRENVRGNAFLGAVQQFFTNMALWGRNSGVPGLKTYLKIDENTTKRIRDEYRKKFQASAPKDYKEPTVSES
jgi:hypothetical protein